ncbi:chromosome segregation protein SMC, partial [Microbispora triticiradicis]
RAADSESQRAVAALQARCEALEMSLAGGADGAAALLGAGLPGVLGPVATLLAVRPGAEAAVAAVLAVDGVAVASLTAAVAAVEHLREAGAGRAALLVAVDRNEACDRPEPPVAGAEWAADLVTVPDELRPAVEALLSDVVVVPDLPAARKVVDSHPELRAVTTSGDLLGVHAAHGGSGGGSSLLQMRTALDEAAADLATARAGAERHAEALAEAVAAERECQLALEEAQTRVAEAQSGVSAAQSGVNDAQNGLNAAQAVLDRLRGRQREADQRAAAAAKQLARLEAAVKAAQDEAARLGGSVRDAQEAREQAQAVVVELEEQLAEAEYAAELEAEPTTDTRDELAAVCGVTRQAEMEARLTVRTAEERARGIAGRADGLLRAAQRERQDRARAAADR